MPDPFLSQLEDILHKHEELGIRAMQPDIARDIAQYTKLMREYSATEPLVAAINAYFKLLKEAESAQEMLDIPDYADMAKEELVELNPRIDAAKDELHILLLPVDPDDAKCAVLEIRAGAGGDEAGLFGAALLRMYMFYAVRMGWKCEVVDDGATEIGGVKEAVVLIQGSGVFGKMKYESGVHRVQRVPVTESGGRIHTSTATVAVLPEAEDVEIQIDPNDLRIDTYRASGAGGQHVNRTDSAVRITHLPTGLVVTSQDERSQIKNRDKAMRVLRSRLYDLIQGQADAQYASARKTQVGTGDRSERIRTYNYPQGRLTDHRIGLTLYKLDSVLTGDLDEVIGALTMHERMEKLRA